MRTPIALSLFTLLSTAGPAQVNNDVLVVFDQLDSRAAMEAVFDRGALPSLNPLFTRRKTAWVGSCSHFANVPDGQDRPLRKSSGMLRSWPLASAVHFNMRNESRYGDGVVDVATPPARYLNQGADFTYGVRNLMADGSYLNMGKNLGEITPAGAVDSARRSISVPAMYEMLQWTYQGGLQIRTITLPGGSTGLAVREDFHAVPIRFTLGGGWIDPSQHVNEPLGPDVSRYCILVDDILTPGEPGADGPIPSGAPYFLH